MLISVQVIWRGGNLITSTLGRSLRVVEQIGKSPTEVAYENYEKGIVLAFY